MGISVRQTHVTLCSQQHCFQFVIRAPLTCAIHYTLMWLRSLEKSQTQKNGPHVFIFHQIID